MRHLHLYLALFVASWMFMYAVSTLVMNHREFVRSSYSAKALGWVPERELDHGRTFPMDVMPEQTGRQTLCDLDLEGGHRVSGGKDCNPLVIDRQRALPPQRITWDANTGKLVSQRQKFRGAASLECMHRRRGYHQPYTLEDTWSLSVDATVVATVFWSLSGLWLWWELRPARLWGAVYGALGLVALALFLVLL